jgi:Ca2+-binding RTX toxin-like protein
LNFNLNSNQLNVVGTGQDDNFIANNGSSGNFKIDGGDGNDIVDYSQLTKSITLTANGIVKKGENGNFGTDTVQNVEGFIGSQVPDNTIDGTTANGAASFNIDLSKTNLTINGLGAPLSFSVKGFNKVIGTNNNDTIKGSIGDETFFGSKGNDTYDGGDLSFATGNRGNVLDYSKLGAGITLGAKGVVSKGEQGVLGTDTSLNIREYVGASGQTNTIDGTTTAGTGSFNINLANNSLKIDGLPGGQVAFTVVNFGDVVGTNNNDTIVGNNDDNKLTGGRGNDILTGGNGNDILNGTNSTARGVGEVDTLTGGGGADTFVLGDKSGSFYLGNGKNDYASITDFDFTKDRIQLGGNKDLLSVKFDRRTGTVDLFSKQSGGKDLVAKVKLANPFNFSSRGELGMGNAKTAMAGSGIGDDVALGTATIGGDSTSIESMFAKSIVG